jgi:hypothetical protein
LNRATIAREMSRLRLLGFDLSPVVATLSVRAVADAAPFLVF